MLDCFLVGIMLYCGNAGPPIAMFPQSNQLPTEYMAQQMIQARQYERIRAGVNTRAAPSTPSCRANEIRHDGRCWVVR